MITGNKREVKRIALKYVDAPDELNIIEEYERIQLRKIVAIMFAEISKDIHFDFTKEDPYKYDTVEQMRWDYEHKRIIKVNVSGNDSTLWGPVYNLMFRAVHDYVHAKYGYHFNYKAEVDAYFDQLNLTVKLKAIALHNPIMFLYEKVLRSEIIYQAAYKTHFDQFHLPVQKIILQNL